MSNRIIIKPAKNIKHHFQTAKNIIEYKDQYGNVMSTSNGELRDRYPNTLSSTRPIWSMGTHRWKISLGEDELNELVKKCKLTYERGSKQGQLIETADIFDERDPFFNHTKLRVISFEGQTSLLKDVAKDKIIFEAMKNNTIFGSRGNGLMAGNVRFIISDEQGDRQFELDQVNSEIDAIVLFEGLVHDKKLMIASALGFKASVMQDPDSLKLAMYAYLKSQHRGEDNLFNREKFMAIAKEDSETVSIKSLISKAKLASVIRFDKAKGFTYGGTIVARDEKEMLKFLSDANNKDTLEKIIDAVKEKEKS